MITPAFNLTATERVLPRMALDFTTGILDPRVTFTRGSNATLVDATGKITYAPANLLTYSQEFDNAAAWIPAGATVSANQTLAPDGTTTADKIAETAVTNNHAVYRSVSGSAGGTYTLSFFFKAAERGFARAGVTDGGVDYAVRIDLSTGAITLTSAGISGAVTSFGNGWYRLAVTRTVANASFNVFAGPNLDATGTSAYAGTTGSGIFAWGAQLEPVTYQTTPSTYVATTTAAYYGPRFDYDPVTLAPKGLLIEEQRTNLVLNSSGFTSATWTKSLSAMAGTFTTAPDGTNTGAKWREDNTTNEHAIYATPSLSAALHTETWYLKAAERTKVQVSLATAGLAYGASVIADLSAGTLSAVTNRGIHTGATATISSAGNGWYRVSLTITATATTYYPALTLVTGTNTTNYLGDGTSGIFIWGAQVETGGFATSYIPTAASLVTRSADVATMTGTNFSSWYNQTQGTFVANFDKYSTTSRGGVLCAGNISGASGTGITIDGQNNGKVRAFIENAGAIEMLNATLADYTANTPIKGAVAYATNNAVGAAAGALGTVDTSVVVPTVDNLQIGAIRNNSLAALLPLNGHIRSISYYIIRVLNAELQAFSK